MALHHSRASSMPRDQASEQTPLISATPHLDHRGNGHHAQDNRRQDSQSEPSSDSQLTTLSATGVILGTFFLIFVLAINFSSMSILQSPIAHSLPPPSSQATLFIITAYLIPASSLSPLAGRLADILGPRVLIIPIILLQGIGSTISATAATFQAFIAGRVVAGVGAAGVLALAIITVLALVDEKRRGLFVGLVNAALTFGVSVGAVVSGALYPLIGWRPIFWAQCPIVLAGGLLLYASFPSKASDPKASKWQLAKGIDYIGAVLLSAAITGFLYALSGHFDPIIFVISLISLAAFLLWEFRVPADPIIPLRVLMSRGTLLSCLTQIGVMAARWTVLFYTPVFMLAVLGYSPASAGAILIPTNAGFALGGLVVGALHIRRSGSFYISCLVSCFMIALTLYGLSLAAAPERRLLPAAVTAVFLSGFATGAFLNYTLAHVLHLGPNSAPYITTSLLGTFRGFGGSFGTALGGGLFQRMLSSYLTLGFQRLDGTGHLAPARASLVERLIGSPDMVWSGELSNADKAVALGGYLDALKGLWRTGAALILIMMVVQAGTGWKAERVEDHAAEARANVVENEGVGEA